MRLDKEHEDFLIRQDTLVRWAGKTLQERAKLFHRAYPNKIITANALQCLYKSAKVSRKLIRISKVMPLAISMDFVRLHAELSKTMKRALKTGHRIVFLDEVCFTRSTMQARAYSAKGERIEVDQKAYYDKYYSVVASISTANKVEHLHFEQGAINNVNFRVFLKNLRRKLGDIKVYLFMDNLGVHQHPLVLAMYEELKFTVILNVKYMPEFMPAETVFAHVKGWYSRQRLQALANGEDFDTKSYIRKAFARVKPETIAKCI